MIFAKGIQGTTKDVAYTRGQGYLGGISGIISRTVSQAQPEYFHYNPQGSVMNLSNQDALGSAVYSYDAYGQTTSSWFPGDNPYRFSTKEWVGYENLNYFGSRYYDPELGRWLTPDPSGVKAGLNKYLYSENNPVNMIDPDGKQAVQIASALYGAVTGGATGYSIRHDAGDAAKGAIAGAFFGLLGGVLADAVEGVAYGAAIGALTGAEGNAFIQGALNCDHDVDLSSVAWAGLSGATGNYITGITQKAGGSDLLAAISGTFASAAIDVPVTISEWQKQELKRSFANNKAGKEKVGNGCSN